MQHQDFWLSATDGSALLVNHWYSESPPKAVVMIAHGMAEHSARYARLAECLVADDFAVFALDQRGHGRTAERGVLGHYADADGWNKVVGDLASLNHHIRQQHPQAPIFLLAHSMGSYIGQAYLMQHSTITVPSPEIGVLGQLESFLLDLLRQFTRGRQHHGIGPIR